MDFLTISYIVIGLVGVIGNSFACAIIIGHRPLRTRLANYYIISQCALDLLVSVLQLTNMTTFTDYTIQLNVGGMLDCYLWKTRVFLLGFMTSSVFNIVALTIERYFEIIHPIKHKLYFGRGIVVAGISAAWLMGIVFKMCHMYPSLIITADGVCIPGGKAIPTIGVTNFLGEYFIDLCIISFCYVRMGRKLLQSVGPRAAAAASSTTTTTGGGVESMASRARRNIFKTLLTVVVCLALTGLLKQVLSVVNGLGIYSVDWSSGIVYKVSLILQFSNCCVNPFIYMFQYKEFQRGVVVLLRLRKLRPAAIKVSTTRTHGQETAAHI